MKLKPTLITILVFFAWAIFAHLIVTIFKFSGILIADKPAVIEYLLGGVLAVSFTGLFCFVYEIIKDYTE